MKSDMPAKASLFVSAQIVSINLEALDQAARREWLSAADVCDALRHPRPSMRPARGAAAATLPPPGMARDYELVRVAEIDEAIRAASNEDLKRLLQSVADQARSAGVMVFAIPVHDGRGALVPGQRPIPQAPAFVREAKSVEPVPVPAPDRSIEDEKAELAERMSGARRWMEPHADGVRLTLAKASRALGFEKYRDALYADTIMGTTMQVFFAYLAFTIASRSASRIGGHANTLDLTLGLVGVIMNPTPEKDGEVTIAELGNILLKVLLQPGGDSPWPRHVNSEVFHQMEQCCPKEDSTFHDPSPDKLESAIAASLNLALAVRRVWAERAAFGLES